MVSGRRFAYFRASCLLIVAGGLFACAGADPPPSDRFISVGSHRLQIHQEGKGVPTVVIDVGITDQLDRFRVLQGRLARVTHVATYNRAGYGQSEPGPLPRHSGREADELKALLENASKYPDDVAGMILLDPPPVSFLLGEQFADLVPMAERMTAEWQDIADSSATSANTQEKARANFFRMIASEHREMFEESARLAAAISTFGDLPLIVVAAGRPNSGFGDVAEEYQAYWIEQSRALSRRSTRGRFILVEESILSVLEETRARAKPTS